MTVFDVITLLGGLAFFLFGMSTMGSGLKNLAGNKMEKTLRRLTAAPVRGLILGIIVTAIIQSSSAATVMVVSFVNAGMMKVAQIVTVVLGAQIGTTMTGWILTLAEAGGGSGLARVLSASTFVPVCALIGIALNMFAKKQSSRHVGMILLGFTFLMTGMSTMSSAVSPLKSDPAFIGMLTLFDNPLAGFLMGLVLGAVLQSCSAGVGILQALSVTGILTLSSCLPIMMGINIGCCTPVWLTMLSSGKNGKRAALCYILSAAIGSILILIVFLILNACGLFSFMDAPAGTVQLAVMNTVTRAISVLVLTPFYRQIAALSMRCIPYNPQEEEDSASLDQLTESALRYPSTAVSLSLAAASKMAEIARKTVADSVSLLFRFDRGTYSRVVAREELLDRYEDKLGDFLMHLHAVESMPDSEHKVGKILSCISDLERLGDHAQNIADLALEMVEKKQVFSEDAAEELRNLSDALNTICMLATDSFETDDLSDAYRVEPLEEVIDIVCDELKLRHVNRLQAGLCTISVGFVFNDLLTNIERISDHCSNLAIYTLRAQHPDYMPHEYSSNAEASTVYTEAFLEYTEQYVSNL